MKLVQNLCSLCKHRRNGLACDAFPGRIPRDIRMMYADHRLPYPGDHSIQFEVLDTEEARHQLRQVKVVNKPRPRPNELDRRIAMVLTWIRFKDRKERRQFTLVALNTEAFDQLPGAYQQLILDAEQQQVRETNQRGSGEPEAAESGKSSECT